MAPDNDELRRKLQDDDVPTQPRRDLHEEQPGRQAGNEGDHPPDGDRIISPGEGPAGTPGRHRGRGDFAIHPASSTRYPGVHVK
ncbi:MAG TPA: hypothetical protein VK447_00530 [Myxococcaceae bacterium]|nr:hypothetical protein [Myxococcaceae bacterium]